MSVTTEENSEKSNNYFKQNQTASIQKAARTLKISKTTVHKILEDFLQIHPYTITTHQLLTERVMTIRMELCKKVMASESLVWIFQIYSTRSRMAIIFTGFKSMWFFFRGGRWYSRDHCYARNPKTVSDLAARNVVRKKITDEMLEKGFMSFHKRIEFCTNSDGAHFVYIYH